MKITAIMGSHRSGGHTRQILDVLLEQIQEGNTIEQIDVNRIAVKPCLGCDYCATHQNQCVLEDDMAAVHEKILGCEVLIIASPVYFSAFPGKMKNLIDRGQMLFALEDTGFIPPKKLVLIGVGGARSYPFQFDGLYHTMTYYNRNIKAEPVAFIKIPNTDRVAAVDNAEALTAVRQCAVYIQGLSQKQEG